MNLGLDLNINFRIIILKRFILHTLALLFPLIAHSEQWRLHPTYDGSLSRIVDTEKYTYLLSQAQPFFADMGDFAKKYFTLFRYDKEGEEILGLNKQNLLSDNVLQTIEYNRDNRYLMAVYDNGNIDLIYDNGDVVNIPGLKLASSDYSKSVYSISFSPENNETYLATDFGFIVIDDKNAEIKRTVQLDKRLTAVARFGNKLVVGNDEGLYYTDFKNYPKFEDMEAYPGINNVRLIRPELDHLYVLYGYDRNTKLPYFTLEEDTFIFNNLVNGEVMSVEPRKDGFQISGIEGLWCFDNRHQITQYVREAKDIRKNIVGWDGNIFFKDNGREGISIVKAEKSDNLISNWTTLAEKIIPNAANAYKSTYMAYSPKYGMLVRNLGVDPRMTTYDAQVPDLISSYKNFEWMPRSATYHAPGTDLRQMNPKGVAIDPNNPDHIYSGSVFQGLLRLDLSDYSKSLKMGREGDSWITNGRFVSVHKDSETWPGLSPFSNPSFDQGNNLWVSWFDRDKKVKGIDNLEFWYWTPANRAATKDASTFQPFGKISVKGVNGSQFQTLQALNASASKNCLLYFSGDYACPLVILDTKGTLDNTTDDQIAISSTFSDRDGSGSVEADYLKCAYEDPSTGDVWIGHAEGVFRFKPSEMLKNPGTVSRIKVSRNDGTSQADYLLSGVSINSITSDPSGRKWFGTSGGGITVTSSDGTEVLKTYTADNSPLPDNTVYGICYNPENNSMMISTDKGLAELFLTTSSADSSKSNVIIYPNPVRPDYFGYVKIEGLQDNALVKVMDSHGNLVKEIGFAVGGEIQWDVTNLNSKRVPGGVYYILASGGPDADSFSAVGKILVVN